MRRLLPILALLVSVIAAPIVLRRNSELARVGQGDDQLVIITPHNETIRSEFGEAFARHWKEKTGRSLNIGWRIPGGTSDIARVLESSYKAADEIGNTGVGIDVFFGGGEPDFKAQAEKGRFVKLSVFDEHPELFAEDVIPATFTGENYYDAEHRWVGCCLSQMGICYNRDAIKRLGVLPPQRWADLGNPAYAGYLALADPTKSGSVGRMFELMIQEQMQSVIEEKGDSPESREEGWKNGLNLLQRLAANARYFTDSASKVPHDVAQGDAAAGTCIDFYGRSFTEKLGKRGPSRLVWTAPHGGTSISVDPVAVLRGAPNAEIAQEFVAFCLSREGQLLWNLKVGTPGGPRETSPRRLPIRRDLYTTELLANFSDPDALPYERGGGFEYRKELTGPAFKALAQIFRAMCIDPHQEMTGAWQTMRLHQSMAVPLEESAGGRVFFDVSHVTYDRLMNEIVPLMAKKDPLATMRLMSGISATFRANYQEAAALAAKGGRL
ncbi:ABC transporter substrate-binding protein [Luteolibacter marinus]|uniref:ABC transporter substrate-binding protein n=1 Tax=Luteolibacter marinus TaxID=2776705 RepID=UPI00186727B7|nr:extracellular solute-binding protein [Luteolibacter marinus]